MKMLLAAVAFAGSSALARPLIPMEASLKVVEPVAAGSADCSKVIEERAFSAPVGPASIPPQTIFTQMKATVPGYAEMIIEFYASGMIVDLIQLEGSEILLERISDALARGQSVAVSRFPSCQGSLEKATLIRSITFLR